MSSWQNFLSLLLFKLDNNNSLAANLFFSSRIPPDLRERLEQHIAKTGESKKQVLINALAAYLNFPISQSNSTSVTTTLNNLLEEKIITLENRIASLELSFKEAQAQSAVNDQIITNNQLDNTLLPEATQSKNDEIVPETQAEKDNSHQPASQDSEDNSDLEYESIKCQEHSIPRELPILSTIELCKKSGLTRSQLDNHKRKLVKKYQELGKSLEDKKMLEFPEKIEIRNPIMIDGYPYDLFYWGQNDKGNNLWTAVPYEHERYQQLSVHNVEEILE